MLSNSEIEAFFQAAPVSIAGNPLLREPQIDGHAAIAAFFAKGGAHAVAQIPVGCGKSGLIAILPFGIARGRVLVIAPNLPIKRLVATDRCRRFVSALL